MFSRFKRNLLESKRETVLSEYFAPEELRAVFKVNAEMHSFNRDQVLFQKGALGKSVYLVVAGQVELMVPVSAFRAIRFRATPGSLIGLPAAFSNEPYSVTAIALRGTELAELGREPFCEMVKADASLSFAILKILAAETRAARAAITELRGKGRQGFEMGSSA